MSPSPHATTRAVLLALVIAAQLWLALPVPPPLSHRGAQRPAVAEELDRWYALTRRWGATWSREELTDRVVQASARLDSLHQAVIRPLRPLQTWTGTGQAWPLFASPETHPWRLEAHVRVEGEWILVLRRLDPTHDQMAEHIRYRRIRGIYNSPGRRGPYPAFARWLGERLLDATPEADAARVRLARLHTTRPHEPPDPRAPTRFPVVVERDP